MTFLRAAVLALAAALGALSLAPATAATPAPDYLRTTHDGTIFEVTDDDVVPLTFAEWADRGFPSFRTASTVFEKVLTFPTVTAITTFDRPGIQLAEDVTWDQYRAAGFPRVTTLAWSPAIFVYKWGTSPELFAQDSVGDIITLSYAQWQGAGFPSFTAREGRGFVRLSWDATGGIAYLCDTAAGRGGRLTYDQWTSLGSPTPMTVTRTANDLVWRLSRGPELSYVGAMNLVYDPSGRLQPGLSNRALTYREWVGMGSPAPRDRIPEASGNLACGQGALSAWE